MGVDQVAYNEDEGDSDKNDENRDGYDKPFSSSPQLHAGPIGNLTFFLVPRVLLISLGHHSQEDWFGYHGTLLSGYPSPFPGERSVLSATIYYYYNRL